MLPSLEVKHGCGKPACTVLVTDCRGKNLCECTPKQPALKREIRENGSWDQTSVTFRGIEYKIEWNPMAASQMGPLWKKCVKRQQKISYIRLMKVVYPYAVRNAVFKASDSKDVWMTIPAAAVGLSQKVWSERLRLRARYKLAEVAKKFGPNTFCRILSSRLIDVDALQDKVPAIKAKRKSSAQWYRGYYQTRRVVYPGGGA